MGVNSTEAVQLVPAGRVVEQVPGLALKGWAAAMVSPVSGPVPGLVMVRDCGALLVPTSTEPKGSRPGRRRGWRKRGRYQ